MRIGYIAASLVGIIILGTTGYTLLEGWSLAESFYMTMITITTVGFNEVRDLSATGRMFTVAIMLLGVGALFYGIAIIAEMRFEERVRHHRERRGHRRAPRSGGETRDPGRRHAR